MRLVFVGVLALLVGLLGGSGASFWWLVPAGAALAGMWIMRRNRCEHLYPALLPSIRQGDGTMLPARWLCCDCGESWAVGPRRDGATVTASRVNSPVIVGGHASITGRPSDQVA